MIVASRTLYIRTESAPIEVPVSVHAPVPDGDAWACSYVIGWPEGDFSWRVMGFDSVQALSIALGSVAFYLYMSPYHAAGTLYFETPGAGYGFPVKSNIRHLAIGDDKDL